MFDSFSSLLPVEMPPRMFSDRLLTTVNANYVQ